MDQTLSGTGAGHLLNDIGDSPANWKAESAYFPLDCSCWMTWAGWKEEHWTGS